MKRWLPLLSWGVCVLSVGYNRSINWPTAIALVVSLALGMFVAYEDMIFPKRPSDVDTLKKQVDELNNVVSRLSMVYGLKGAPTQGK